MDMEKSEIGQLTDCRELAVEAAREAGSMLREKFGLELQVDEKQAYDIKLALDRHSQDMIAGRLLGRFPEHAFYGEEGVEGNQESLYQWIVDPIDGTVNYFYGIPHYCVSIALRHAGEIVVGVIYDPMQDEMWEVVKGGKPELNGREIVVSGRDTLGDSIVTVGFSKSKESIDHGFARFRDIAYKVRKTRMLGSAALAMAYIACGRLDAYIEEEISLWDIAAGKILVENAGGEVVLRTSPSAPEKFFICASNGRIDLSAYL